MGLVLLAFALPCLAQAQAPAEQPSTTGLYFIHPDHLNTPRLIADSTGTTVWRWDQQEPFGNDSPNGDPNSTGTTFEFPLRFPGQYADKETGLAYNMMRDYDSGIARYVQSDPIGLEGGLNTYTYVNGNPLSYVDPLGLWSVTYGGYLGVGGQVTFGNDNGNGFMTGRFGFGLGGGISYNPNGGIPGPVPARTD